MLSKTETPVSPSLLEEYKANLSENDSYIVSIVDTEASETEAEVIPLNNNNNNNDEVVVFVPVADNNAVEIKEENHVARDLALKFCEISSHGMMIAIFEIFKEIPTDPTLAENFEKKDRVGIFPALIFLQGFGLFIQSRQYVDLSNKQKALFWKNIAFLSLESIAVILALTGIGPASVAPYIFTGTGFVNTVLSVDAIYQSARNLYEMQSRANSGEWMKLASSIINTGVGVLTTTSIADVMLMQKNAAAVYGLIGQYAAGIINIGGEVVIYLAKMNVSDRQDVVNDLEAQVNVRVSKQGFFQSDEDLVVDESDLEAAKHLLNNEDKDLEGQYSPRNLTN